MWLDSDTFSCSKTFHTSLLLHLCLCLNPWTALAQVVMSRLTSRTITAIVKAEHRTEPTPIAFGVLSAFLKPVLVNITSIKSITRLSC